MKLIRNNPILYDTLNKKMNIHRNYLPKINLLMLPYMILAILCVLIDYFGLFSYYFEFSEKVENILPGFDFSNFAKITAYIVFFILILLCFILFINYINKKNTLKFLFELPQFSKVDIIFFIIIIAINLVRLPIPDNSFDVLHYHLFLQNFGFENNVYFNFFPSNFHTFTLPLGDRLFFVFRNMFGFRLGTILNTLVLILIYYQIKDLLRLIFVKVFDNIIDDFLISIFAIFIISTEFILANIGIYNVDILMIPFLLEIVKNCFEKNNSSKLDLFLSSLLFGLSVSIKLTSLVFGSILLLFILVKRIKKLRFFDYLLALLLFLFPLIPYLLFNYTQTNNPIFTHFNFIFQSPFYDRNLFSNFVGSPPSEFLQIITWPISILFHPGRITQIPYYSGRITLGYIFIIPVILFLFKKKRFFQSLPLIYIFITTVIWSMVLNRIRYALILEILYGLFIFLLVLLLIKKLLFQDIKDEHKVIVKTNKILKKHSTLYDIYVVDDKSSEKRLGLFINLTILSTIIFLSISQFSYSVYLSTISNKVDWSLRETTYKRYKDVYFDNWLLLGRDKQTFPISISNDYYEVIDEIDAWIVGIPWIAPISGYANLIKPNVPIIDYSFRKTNDHSNNIFREKIFPEYLQNKNIFMLNRIPFDEFKEYLDEENITILDVYEIHPTFSLYPIQLVRVSVDS